MRRDISTDFTVQISQAVIAIIEGQIVTRDGIAHSEKQQEDSYTVSALCWSMVKGTWTALMLFKLPFSTVEEN